MGRTLDVRNEASVTIDSIVARRILQLQREAAELHIERDLFLSGDVCANEARVTGFVDPLEYVLGLAISVSPDDYNENVAKRVDTLVDALDAANIPQRGGILGIFQRIYRRVQQDHARRQISDLPKATYFSLCDKEEPKTLLPEDVPVFSASVLYCPRSIHHTALFASGDDIIPMLRERRVIGHYHVHPREQPELETYFSQGDIDFGVSLKYALRAKKIILGIGSLGKKDHYVSL
ncbi:MAG: hypothetical protein AABX98_05755 [Nanoarchaeota archaeon]